MIRRVLPDAGILEDQRAIEEHYFVEGGPHVRANFVASLDGAIAVGGRSGPLGGEADHSVFMALRAVCDVVMVGAGTVRAENYGPVKLDDAAKARRTARAQQTLPALAIVTNRAAFDPGARVFAGDDRPFIITSAAGASSSSWLTDIAEVVVCGDQAVDISIAVDELSARGYGRVLCEGGPMLFRSIVEADCLDEVCLTFSPVLACQPSDGLLAGLEGEPIPMDLISLLEGGGMLMTRYRVGAPT